MPSQPDGFLIGSRMRNFSKGGAAGYDMNALWAALYAQAGPRLYRMTAACKCLNAYATALHQAAALGGGHCTRLLPT